jgi:hypothetical protein
VALTKNQLHSRSLQTSKRGEPSPNKVGVRIANDGKKRDWRRVGISPCAWASRQEVRRLEEKRNLPVRTTSPF